MDANSPFFEQVRLLVALLPHVARQRCFALKGGTALNLFVRDLPRLSVDIDLAYLPVEGRETSLAAIDRALKTIGADVERAVPRAVVRGSVLSGTATKPWSRVLHSYIWTTAEQMRLGCMTSRETIAAS
jgi:hypothetical protein